MSEKQRGELAKLRAKINAGEKLSNKQVRELKKLETAEERWMEYEKASTPIAVEVDCGQFNDKMHVESFDFTGKLTDVNWSPRLLHMHQKLGGGGFATVFFSKLVKIGLPVAIKVMKADEAHLAQEVQAMRLLADCPHCLALYDYSTVNPKMHAMLIEFLDQDLKHWLLEGSKHSWWTEVMILLDLCKALTACAACDVVHRDVKPENILLGSGSDGVLHTKLGDFGISSLRGQCLDPDAGTVRYSAPELYAEPRHIGPEYDCWSAGIVAYNLFKQSKFPPWMPREPSADDLHKEWIANLGKMDCEEHVDNFGPRVIIECLKAAPPPEDYVPKVRSDDIRLVICGLLHLEFDKRLSAARALDALRRVISVEDAGRKLLASSDALEPASLPSYWCDPPHIWPQEVSLSAVGHGEPSREPEVSSQMPEGSSLEVEKSGIDGWPTS